MAKKVENPLQLIVKCKIMFRNLWKRNHGAVCSIKIFNPLGISIYKVSGFKVDHYLVTDQSIFDISKASEVEVKFVEDDGFTTKASLRIPYKEFISRSIVGAKEGTKGYAMLNVNYSEFSDVPSLKLSSNLNPDIGQSIAVLGFKADTDSLAINTGIVSSYFVKENSSFLQVDTNIQFGNSGSPVIDIDTNEVIGIIGHRLSEINRNYEQLMDIINQNIGQLKEAEGMSSIGELDPAQAILASQNQIKHLTKEIYKSSIQRIGYAYQIGYLVDYFKKDVIAERKKNSVKVRLEE